MWINAEYFHLGGGHDVCDEEIVRLAFCKSTVRLRIRWKTSEWLYFERGAVCDKEAVHVRVPLKHAMFMLSRRSEVVHCVARIDGKDFPVS